MRHLLDLSQRRESAEVGQSPEVDHAYRACYAWVTLSVRIALRSFAHCGGGPWQVTNRAPRCRGHSLGRVTEAMSSLARPLAEHHAPTGILQGA